MRRSNWLVGMVALFAAGMSSGVMSCVFKFDTGSCDDYPAKGCPGVGTGTGGNSSSSSSSGGGTGGTGGSTPASCIPSENTMPVDDTCGVFVSSSLGDDANAGSKDKPFKSLGAALGAANGKPVYVCGEAFSETVAITADATVFGGVDCTAGWKYDPTKKAALTAAADAIPLTISGSTNKTEVYDFAITAAAATKDGGSSIGALVAQATVSFTRCDVTAGDGKTGAPGAPFSGSAASGVTGNMGGDACTMSTVNGGEAVSSMCTPNDSIGGPGGAGGSLTGSAGTDGQPGTAVNGGKGEAGSPCSAGGAGDPGGNGNPGLGATMTDLGSLSANGFTGALGSDGKAGAPGQGGGGGGGAKGGSGAAGKCTDSTKAGGASGGSGGSGGCGGLGGKGGLGGGSSIAIASVNGTLTLTNVSLKTGAGGLGGTGGMGQDGGNGGDPGPGGKKGTFTALNDGCPGGKGGLGGKGGQGGGGRGGHSIGIAFVGKAPPAAGAMTWKVTTGSAGMGGVGDTANGGDGAAGVAVDTQQFQ